MSMESLGGLITVAAEQLYITRETVIFLICLFSSIPLAGFTRLVPSAPLKAVYSIVSGATLCYFAYSGIYASIRLWVPALLTYIIIIKASPRFCGYTVYIAAFAYLIFCHAVSLSGDAWRKGGIDFTGTLMVFTLKFVGCAMDVQDGQRVKGEQAKQRMYATRLVVPPSLLDFLGFIFFPGGVLVGPVFDFKAYREYINQEGVWAQGPGKEGPPNPLPKACSSLIKAMITLAGYQALTTYFPGTFFTTEKFFQLPFALRWGYVIAAGCALRWMYYFIWSVAEVAMVLSEFGYSGPSESDPLWSRAINGNIIKVELLTSTSQMPAYWNIWVGRWLRTYVYDRLTPQSGKPTLWTLIATQVVSALWHGLHPGYYLFFVTAAITQNASKVMFRAQQVVAPQPSPFVRNLADAGQSLFKQIFMNYAIAGFLILRADQTIAVWRSLYFLGTIIPLVINYAVPPLTPKPRSKKE